jgi:hypothetical protein
MEILALLSTMTLQLSLCLFCYLVKTGQIKPSVLA